MSPTQSQVSKFSFITFLHLHFFHTLFQLISKLSHDTNFHISHLNLHLIKTLLFQVFLVHAKFCQFSFKYFKFTLTFIISLLTFYFYLYTYRLIFILSRFSLRSKLLSKISYHKKTGKGFSFKRSLTWTYIIFVIWIVITKMTPTNKTARS